MSKESKAFIEFLPLLFYVCFSSLLGDWGVAADDGMALNSSLGEGYSLAFIIVYNYYLLSQFSTCTCNLRSPDSIIGSGEVVRSAVSSVKVQVCKFELVGMSEVKMA